MKKTQNQFYGKECELPEKMNAGSVYFAIDTGAMWIFEGGGPGRKVIGKNSELLNYDSLSDTSFSKEGKKGMYLVVSEDEKSIEYVEVIVPSNGIGISQQAESYSNLLPGNKTGLISYVENPEGTKWLPGIVGGSYYPKGFYIWEDGKWKSDRNAISQEFQSIITSVEGKLNDASSDGNLYARRNNSWEEIPEGINGIDGEKGEKGDPGEKGDTGMQGIQGVPGLKGDKGDKGDTGAQGPNGLKGDDGEKGDDGQQGVQGIQGSKGDKGEKGDKGDKGEDGSDGIQGIQGEQGIQGLKGDKGDKGDNGSNGTSVSFFQVQDNSGEGQDLLTSYKDVSGIWGTAFEGEGFSWNGIELTLNEYSSVLEFNVSIQGITDYNNRVQMNVILLEDSGSGYEKLTEVSQYSLRNNIQNEGNVNLSSFCVFNVNAGTKYKIQVLRKGANSKIGTQGGTYFNTKRYY